MERREGRVYLKQQKDGGQLSKQASSSSSSGRAGQGRASSRSIGDKLRPHSDHLATDGVCAFLYMSTSTYCTYYLPRY